MKPYLSPEPATTAPQLHFTSFHLTSPHLLNSASLWLLQHHQESHEHHLNSCACNSTQCLSLTYWTKPQKFGLSNYRSKVPAEKDHSQRFFVFENQILTATDC